MVRIPFHFGLFYHAMIGLMGRVPDNKVCLGNDGFYDFWYKPQNNKEIELFNREARTIAEWLDNFEIVFSGSRCEFGKLHSELPDGEEILQIRIMLPKKEVD